VLWGSMSNTQLQIFNMAPSCTCICLGDLPAGHWPLISPAKQASWVLACMGTCKAYVYVDLAVDPKPTCSVAYSTHAGPLPLHCRAWDWGCPLSLCAIAVVPCVCLCLILLYTPQGGRCLFWDRAPFLGSGHQPPCNMQPRVRPLAHAHTAASWSVPVFFSSSPTTRLASTASPSPSCYCCCLCRPPPHHHFAESSI
jgi:hypothetical protein